MLNITEEQHKSYELISNTVLTYILFFRLISYRDSVVDVTSMMELQILIVLFFLCFGRILFCFATMIKQVFTRKTVIESV